MKNVFIFILIFHLFGCNNILKNKQTLVDFDCPKVFFSSENRIFIDNSNSLDDVLIRAELNNFAINNKCILKDNMAIIPLDVLIIIKAMDNLENPEFNIPVYISLLDQNDELIENQFFMISGFLSKDPEKKSFIESDISDRLEVITPNLNVYEIVVGFMLDDKKRELLN
tara:strand:- start:272 stop:778 length:507 start_codon:yes stop_codon:yes gene_type:complete